MAIIIPSFEPDEKLVHLINQINEYKIDHGVEQHIIVVNDGSDNSYDTFFNEVKEKGCIVLKHAVNLGKGRALKTAFNYYLNHFPDGSGAVTADSDGQHSVSDIFRCVLRLEQKQDKLILGVRNFDDKTIPLRSRFGNKMTHMVFKGLCGINVSDTQTGLRGIPTSYMKSLVSMSGERFEYEMNMLIESKNFGVKIDELPIQTIYIEGNATSHFNPIKDSIKIYSLFLKFIVSSLASFAVDIVLFTIFLALLKHSFGEKILVATILARICSSVFNFKSNQKLVFKNRSTSKWVPIKYFGLVIVQMLLSAYFVELLFKASSINPSAIKILVDCILFILSFQIQQHWIFNNTIKKVEHKL